MKGFWRTVESAMSVMIIMGFLVAAGGVYFATTGGSEPSPSGREKLIELDGRGELRPPAADKDYSAIESMIDVPGYSHSVMICDFGGSCWGNSSLPPASAANVLVSSYLIAGNDSYSPLEIRLYMWR
jgi:hypothetical protein